MASSSTATSSAAAFLNGGPSTSSSRKMGNHPRQTSSSLYTAFSPKQIQGFKEAFNMIDTDSDGLISPSDIATMLSNLGINSSSSSSQDYIKPGSAGVNFTQFLTMFGEHLAELDDQTVLMEAFECFSRPRSDEESTKVCIYAVRDGCENAATTTT